jgi:anti-sigma regulatory factor (Ser/Thr protein kinase)
LNLRESPAFLKRSFAPNLTAPAGARRALEGLVGPYAEDLRERSGLVLTEVVTNSVLHAGLTPSQAIDLEMALSPELLRFEVTDNGPGFEPTPVASKPDQAPGGWGLWLVDELSDRWGVDFSHSTRVWCEFDTDAAEAPSDCSVIDSQRGTPADRPVQCLRTPRPELQLEALAGIGRVME